MIKSVLLKFEVLCMSESPKYTERHVKLGIDVFYVQRGTYQTLEQDISNIQEKKNSEKLKQYFLYFGNMFLCNFRKNPYFG